MSLYNDLPKQAKYEDFNINKVYGVRLVLGCYCHEKREEEEDIIDDSDNESVARPIANNHVEHHHSGNTTLADFLTADLSFVNKSHCLISNPPYDLLEEIALMVTGEKSIFNDVILMIPKKKLGLFPDFKIVFILNENDFNPPTKPGEYLVIIHGFDKK